MASTSTSTTTSAPAPAPTPAPTASAPAPIQCPDLPKPLPLPLSAADLASINAYLSTLSPQDILRWGLEYLPNLYQTTAFGLTGLVAIDMLSKITSTSQSEAANTSESSSESQSGVRALSPPPLIFLDTLYHFQETYELVEEVKRRYGVPVHVFKPEGCETVQDFERKFGERHWETDEGNYDFVVKVEPAQRAYKQFTVQSVITGRRASQGASRATLQPLEVDSTGLLKLNPLFAWDFAKVEAYIKAHGVPRNRLLDQGYRSVGDWHSTRRVKEGEDERAGRWAGKEKTECGLHEDYFKMKAKAKAAAAAQAAEEQKAKEASANDVPVAA